MNNKKDEMLWLKNAILEYLKTRNNSKTNSQDIIIHFKLSADVTFTALMEMVKDGEVERINFFAEGWYGNHTYVLPSRIESIDETTELHM